MILALIDIDQPGESHVDVAGFERAVEVSVDITGQRYSETRVTSGVHKSRSAGITETVVVQNEVDVNLHTGVVQNVNGCLQTGLRAVQRRSSRHTQIEAIKDVVADRLIAGIRASRRRYPHTSVSRRKDVRRPVFDVVVRTVEDLQNGWRRDIQNKSFFQQLSGSELQASVFFGAMRAVFSGGIQPTA